MPKFILSIFLFFTILTASAQISKNDSLRIKAMAEMTKDTLKKVDLTKIDLSKIDTSKIEKIISPPYKISPKIATKRSAMIPGWGQLYIKQKWILPVIYGGFAVNGYFIVRWNKNYKAFKNEYFRVSAFNDEATEFNNNLIKNKDEITPRKELLTNGEVTIKGNSTTFSLTNLKEGTRFYRRNRDGSFLILPVVWALNILEVNVAAHLKTFDMSDDITMKFEPSFEQTITGFPSVGGKVVFVFK